MTSRFLRSTLEANPGHVVGAHDARSEEARTHRRPVGELSVRRPGRGN
jgi:hypothetical protein